MKCPSCNTALTMSERSGIEIDYCPQCRGIWLDRGELDKIIEKSSSAESSQQLKSQDENRNRRNDDDDDDDDGGFFNRNRGNENKTNPNRKKGGFLGDLFDF